MRVLAVVAILVLAGCASAPPAPQPFPPLDPNLLLDRLTWGANASSRSDMAQLGPGPWLERQLKPPPQDDLPPEAAKQVAALAISQKPVIDIAADLAVRYRGLRTMAEGEEKKAMIAAYQKELTVLGREAAARSVLRALYSPWQLREQMTWFWMNHFNVFLIRGEVRATVGDYEENAVRPHALGSFRALLGAVARHPAMLRYLDNAENAAGRLNENYARELMELHTLGVEGGYTQKDVQELARVLTGFGISARDPARPSLRLDGYTREGMFEFNPRRHDYGDKVLLGQPIRARGLGELDEALDRLAAHPSTARFVSRKLAVFFVADQPSEALVERLAAEWTRSNGDIARVLRVLFASDDFRVSSRTKFKDGVHYVYSAVRLADDGSATQNPQQVMGWMLRLGQPLYARATPDGYPLTREHWASAGQMTARFEVARAIGYRAAKPLDPTPFEPLGAATLKVLDSARSPQERNMLLLASPEFMWR